MAENRKYQLNFSQLLPQAMFDVCARRNKAQTMLQVMRDHLGSDLTHLRLLDIGSSTGIIADFLADHFREVIGIDLDAPAVAFARQNCRRSNLFFAVGDSLNLGFSDNAFDVAICAQVYEHVPDAGRMMKEVFRVLKPGGICYFAAGNRLALMEPHYRLPLLSVIPRPVANLYIRLAGKSTHYHEHHLTYWGLKELVHSFEVIDYTRKIVAAPDFFHAGYMLPEGSWKTMLSRVVARVAYWLFPGYIWLLKKPR
jgi:2-polyprenyl-3-methyl-5-hydroxy-6-metoxy-1,4-benzoquinol methylase